ncbi:MAG: ligase-associated DNA damage response exonuclease [Pseudomonadota bacterium]|nr:ligase-associated DNA damage response exonuclease [Pseudomonadota bacterium]
MPPPESWLNVTPKGLYCVPGDFFIDPNSAVERAVITHGHADHARPGHSKVLATAETIEINDLRMGKRAARSRQALQYGEMVAIGGVNLRLAPAGHILGSAQIVLEHKGSRVVVSGDYKRRTDPTCTGFEVVACDVFITEATFALPVFQHPPDKIEIDKLLASVQRNPDRAHVVGVYALGKAQRVMALLRQTGYEKPFYVHRALQPICELYVRFGSTLGELRVVTPENKKSLAGEIILAPPGATRDRWTRGMPNPLIAFASGWMRIRQRARQRGVELPLILSDHADWSELTATIEEVDAGVIWITHGREDALAHYAESQGIRARSLSMLGYEEENE